MVSPGIGHGPRALHSTVCPQLARWHVHTIPGVGGTGRDAARRPRAYLLINGTLSSVRPKVGTSQWLKERQ